MLTLLSATAHADKMWFTGEAHREPDIYGRVILDDNDEEADEG